MTTQKSYGDQTLKDFVMVQRNLIPKNLCDYIIDDSKKNEWRPHTWYNSQTDTFGSEETKELDVQNVNDEIQNLLTPFIIQSGANYNAQFAFDDERTRQIMYKFSKVRLNRYSPGQIMRFHQDHISSLFSGENRGIPVLSFILNFNEDYDGGELVLWKDHPIKLGCGDVLIFPSLFMFPHSVNEVTRNHRYSGVAWSW